MKSFSLTTSLIILTNLVIHADQPAPQNIEEQVTIQAPIALGEFFDKLTILIIKREKIHDPKKLVNINKEYMLLTEIYTNQIGSSNQLQNLIDSLLKANKSLWELEDKTREKERAKCFDDDFKQLVKSILEHNDTRFSIKRAINILLDSPLIEEKSYKKILAQKLENSQEPGNTSNITKSPLITTPLSLADLLDRISILEIKLEKIENTHKRKHIRHEHDTLFAIYLNAIKSSANLDKLYQKLLAANKRMWDIQDNLRKKVLDRELDDNFIQLGRSVYYTNDERVQIKQEINRLFNSSLVEEKMYAQY